MGGGGGGGGWGGGGGGGGNKITKTGRYFHCGLVHLASLNWNAPKIFHTVFETLPVGAKSLPILTLDY